MEIIPVTTENTISNEIIDETNKQITPETIEKSIPDK